MMRKFMLSSVLIAVILLMSINLHSASAETLGEEQVSVVALQAGTCGGQVTDEQLKTLAKMIITEQVPKAARDCYEAMNVENKTKLFEVVIEQRGLSVDELRKEAREDLHLMSNARISNGLWSQLIEHTFYDLTDPPVYSNGWWQDSLCDGDSGDVDYVFHFAFSSPMSNPDRLRTNSLHMGVDAMLWWYHYQYGGIKGWGSTGSVSVSTCLGDTGVAGAGGPQTVYNYMRLMLKQ